MPTLFLAGALIAGLLYLQAPDDIANSSQDFSVWKPVLGYLFWLSHSLSGLLLMSAITQLLLSRVPSGVPGWLSLLGAGVLGALCFAPFAGVLEYLFAAIGVGEADAQSIADLLAPKLIAEEFVELLPGFVLSWVLLNFSYQSLQASERPEGQRSEPPEPEINAKPEGLLSLLPSELGQELLVISADLNYVHVTTSVGTAMVLYSLSRAAQELDELGVQVHRSHWVSRAAVVAVRRTRQGMQIELPDGRLIPVSRRKERIVREQFGSAFRRTAAPVQSPAEKKLDTGYSYS